MKLPDAIAPYASLLKWILIAALVLGLFGGGLLTGCQWQGSRDADKVAAAERQVNVRNEALQAAATALRKARNTFQWISDRTRESVAAAQAVQEQGARIARQATKDRLSFEKRQAALELELKRERESCTEGRARICGTPLR